MKGKTTKQKHLIHLHQNNYEAKRWKSGLLRCARLDVQTHTGKQRNGGIKIKAKVEKASWREKTIRKKYLFSFLSLNALFLAIEYAPLCGRNFSLVFIEKYADLNFSCTLKSQVL